MRYLYFDTAPIWDIIRRPGRFARKYCVFFFDYLSIIVKFAVQIGIRAMESLKEKTANGLLWGGISNGGQQLLGLVFGIILGRLLSPDDYGMIAMISVFSLVANELQNSGFKTALANIPNPTDRDYNSVFWFNILMGVMLYTLLFFSAPLIARFYGVPELVPLCRYAFLGFVIAGLGTVQSAWLFKNLKAKQQAKSGLAAVLISSGVGVALAFGGFSYWALATQSIVFISIHTSLQWHYSTWRPSLHVDFGPVRGMFRFSCKLLLSNIITHINTNVLNILLGLHFSKRDVGYYNQAYQWNSKCFYTLQGMVQTVAQPIFVELKDNGDRQLAALRKLMRVTAFISFPMLFGFGLVAHEFIVITITDKWEASAVLIKILCIGGAFMPLSTLLSNLVVSKGHSGTYMMCNVCLGLLQIVLMTVFYRYGIHTMVTVYVVLNTLWVFVWHHFVRRFTGYGFGMILADIMPFALSALAVMAATHCITAAIGDLRLLMGVRIVTAAALYYVVMRFVSRSTLDECMLFVKSKIRK